MDQRNLKNFVYYGIIFELMTNFYKPFSAKFLERIGGNEFHISLLNSLPGVATILAILLGMIFINRSKPQKTITIITMMISRIFILFFAMVPAFPDSVRPMLFVLLNFAFNLPLGIYQVSYQSFIAQLFSSRDRASAISTRNRATIIPTMIVTFATGFMIARLPGTEDQRILLYQIFFVMSFLLGIYEYFIFSKLKPIYEQVQENSSPTLQRVKNVLSDKFFMGFMACSLLFHFGWQMGWPLFTIYMIDNLGADEAWLSIIAVVSAMSMFIGYTYWGRKIQHWGNSPVLAITTLGMALTPILYVVSKNMYVLTVMSLISGFFTAGTNTVLMSGLLEAAPDKDRPMYISIYSIMVNLSLAIAPLLGHRFMVIKDIYFALIITALFRTIGSMSFFIRRKIQQEGAK